MHPLQSVIEWFESYRLKVEGYNLSTFNVETCNLTYPFGWPIPGRQGNPGSYRFGFQGQFAEEDSETGWAAFELRMLGKREGRWLMPDPYDQYHSPYIAMNNNPILTVDPDGGCDDPPCNGDPMPGTKLAEVQQLQTVNITASRLPANNFQPNNLMASMNMVQMMQNSINTNLTDIKLDNGNIVQLIFLQTQSDRINSNQPVHTDLKRAFEGAVREASQNTPITSITITATTNGQHGSNSRHYTGKGVDIGAINGNLVNPGNKEAHELQKAFNNQTGARENFGPALMMKSGKDYIHSGLSDGQRQSRQRVKDDHQDHLHFTVD